MKGKELFIQNFTKCKRFVKGNFPTLMTVVGSIGVIATAFVSFKSGKDSVTTVKYSDKKSKIKRFIKIYIPPTLMAASTIACFISADIANINKQKSLISSYALLRESFDSYISKVKEMYGDDANTIVKDSVIGDNEKSEVVSSLYRELLTDNVQLDPFPKGKKYLFFDEMRNEFFESTVEEVLQAEYTINRMFRIDGYVTLNNFHEMLGLDSTEIGELMAWSSWENIGSPFDSEWIDFTHRKITLKDGRECYVIETPFPPPEISEYEYDYAK